MQKAVIRTGGKQYVVAENQLVKVDKLSHAEGESFEISDVLAVFDEEKETCELGTPVLASKVSAVVVKNGRSKKIRVVKYKAKVRYRKVHGHRQDFTQIKITKIA